MGAFAKPGGIIVISMPDSVNLKKRIDVILGRSNFPSVEIFFKSVGMWRGHVREYTLKEAVYICKEVGLKVLSAKTFEDLAYEKLPILARQIYILLGNIIKGFRSDLLVVCKKPENWKIVEKDLDGFRKALAKGVPKGVA